MAHKKKLPKKPRKPRASAPLSSWLKFDAKMHAWHKKVSEIKSGEKKREQLIKKYAHA